MLYIESQDYQNIPDRNDVSSSFPEEHMAVPAWLMSQFERRYHKRNNSEKANPSFRVN
jgi:hypothetical protein